MHKLSKETIELLWRDNDVPINDNEEIDDDFCGWERFTDREEIWSWFDEQYARWGGVHALMFPAEHGICPRCHATIADDGGCWQCGWFESNCGVPS